MDEIKVIRNTQDIDSTLFEDNVLFGMDIERLLDSLPEKPIFDLIGKEYEKKLSIEEYEKWQERIIKKIYVRLKDTGSVCWQVGSFVESNEILPLDYVFAPIFKEIGMHLRNRIVWHFGHGLHNKKRFSGRYEVILWYNLARHYIMKNRAMRFIAPVQRVYSLFPASIISKIIMVIKS